MTVQDQVPVFSFLMAGLDRASPSTAHSSHSGRELEAQPSRHRVHPGRDRKINLETPAH